MAIKCPKCGGKTKNVESRTIEKINGQYRRRKCLECGWQFNTVEHIIESSVRMPNTQFRTSYLERDELQNLYDIFGI